MKLCHITGHKVGMITYVQILRGLFSPTPKKWASQEVENLVQFRTPFDFDREYLRNRSRYQKSETNLIDNDPCQVQQKMVNYGSLTSTDVDLP